MDSLTQIALGAAVAEVTLGKKIGNKSILWGAIAGTIPDLDVLANGFISPLDALSFHRGISHSFLFSILAAAGLGPLVHWIYESKWHHRIAFSCWAFLFLGIGIPILFSSMGLVVKLIAFALILIIVYSFYKKYHEPSPLNISATRWDWTKLFFLAIVTHPILDTFTTYGTQLFQPFSSVRVGFNNISVADPLYTIPLIVAIILMSRYARTDAKRQKIMWIGIVISSLYMAFTIWNKSQINSVFVNSLKKENIVYKRYMTSPTILNNVLWFCLAEREDDYVFGLYSQFDKKNEVVLQTMPKNWDRLNADPKDEVINTLEWFSNGYYAVMERRDGSLQINDMRYGTFDAESTDEESFIFRFGVEKQSDGMYILTDEQAGPPNENRNDIFKNLWARIKGI